MRIEKSCVSLEAPTYSRAWARRCQTGAGRISATIALAAAIILFHPVTAGACAACYGQSDAPMAKGMNWGIVSLLGMVGVVLGILSAFFVFLAKKAATTPVTGSPLEPTDHIET